MNEYEHLGDRLDYAGRVYRRGDVMDLSEAEGERLIAAGLPISLKVAPVNDPAPVTPEKEPAAPAEVKNDGSI